MRPWLSALRSVSLGVAFAALVSFLLLVGIGQAQAAPAGSGWLYCGPVCFRDADAGTIFEVVFASRHDETCASSVAYSEPELSPVIGVDWFPAACLDASGSAVPESEAGIWYRVMYVSAEPPDGPASAPVADLSTVESHLELFAYAGFVVAAGLGYSGGRLR